MKKQRRSTKRAAGCPPPRQRSRRLLNGLFIYLFLVPARLELSDSFFALLRETKKSAGKKEEKRKSAGGDKDKERVGGNDSFKSREFIETSEESSSDSGRKGKSKKKKKKKKVMRAERFVRPQPKAHVWLREESQLLVCFCAHALSCI